MISISTLNAMSLGEFVQSFGDVAEHSPWVAEEAFKSAPFRRRDDVVAAFDAAMRHAVRDQQLALIRAHPDLAGKAAIAGGLADDSKREQANAGLDQLTPEEFAQFTLLNADYNEKFGFPFIFAVKGANKGSILRAFEQRIGNERAQEFETALIQIGRIFRFRLEDRIAEDA